MLVFLSSDPHFCAISAEYIVLVSRRVSPCLGVAIHSRNHGQRPCSRLYSEGGQR